MNVNASTHIRLGARGSALSRWQVEWVAAQLAAAGASVQIEFIKTGGDLSSQPIASLGERGVFTKEIQRAVLAGRVDVAVHSLKDLPTEPVDGLALVAVPPRESPFDLFLSRAGQPLTELPERSRVGTGSRRRQAQLLHLRPDLHVTEMRGNVETRLKKLSEGEYDAIVLAEAGLSRLGLAHHATHRLEPHQMLPAIGQGALGIEARVDDEPTRTALQVLQDPITFACVTAERALLATLRGGCLAPVGGWARLEGEQLRLEGVVLSLDGRERLYAAATAAPQDAIALGERVAAELRAAGAERLIERIRPESN